MCEQAGCCLGRLEFHPLLGRPWEAANLAPQSDTTQGKGADVLCTNSCQSLAGSCFGEGERALTPHQAPKKPGASIPAAGVGLGGSKRSSRSSHASNSQVLMVLKGYLRAAGL